jgi:hypothetical protein
MGNVHCCGGTNFGQSIRPSDATNLARIHRGKNQRRCAMATVVDRVDFRDVAYTGVTAGLIFAGFEVITTAFLTGAETAAMPLRMISAIVLGPAALDSHYSLVVAGVVGMAIHLLLSVAFAALFAATVRRIARATAGELLTTSGQLAVAGVVFGTVLWLVNFYFVAPLAGWIWFPGNVHHIVAFLGHAFFFGCPLSWMFGRAAGLTPIRA